MVFEISSESMVDCYDYSDQQEQVYKAPRHLISQT